MSKMRVFLEEQENKFKKFDADINLSRDISRKAIFQIIVLSGGIVGFSVSLFSAPGFENSLNIGSLKISWYFFTATIILGFLILLLEGRVRFASTWKGFQLSKFPQSLNDYKLKEKSYAFFITFLTVIYPANLVFNRHYVKEDEKNFKLRVNGIVVNFLARFNYFLISLEGIVFILFTVGIIMLILSVGK